MALKNTKEKDCFSEDRHIYEFDKKISAEFVDFLSQFGHVNVFWDFPIPLIKMDVKDMFRLSAVMGSTTMRVCFKKNAPEGFKDDFEKKLEIFLQKATVSSQ